MTRTQILLPDAVYQRAKVLAEAKEISLAELCRRGLEHMLSVYPDPTPSKSQPWDIPKPRRLGGSDPFSDPDWREKLSVVSQRRSRKK